jgi:SAM-dependent methyltransferase
MKLEPKRGPGTLYRKLKTVQFLATRDRRAVRRFLLSRDAAQTSFEERLSLLKRFIEATHAVRGYHTLSEMLSISRAILERSERLRGPGRGPVVVEAGCGYGSSTAKLSLATRLAGGRLIVCDSFRGIPENDEQHHRLDGSPVVFRTGAFHGRLSLVKRRVAALGAIEVCRFEPGWFDETLPRISTGLEIDVLVLDVDLTSSVRVCLRELWPQVRPDGIAFSMDGQLRETHELLADQAFWENEVRAHPPSITGLGRAKLLRLERAVRRM